MINRLRLMDWKAYRYHRFRKIRNSLYPGSINRMIFPAGGEEIDPKHVLDTECGECQVWIPHGEHLDSVDLERMVMALRRNPRLDGVYIPKNEALQPHPFPLLMRKYTAWGLGDWPDPKDPQDASIFWLQASLAFKLQGVGMSGSTSSTSLNLFLELEKRGSGGFNVLADFCRDFYLCPWVCFLRTDRLGPRSSLLMDRLKEAITSSGNIIYEGNDFHTESYPRLWVPTVYLLAIEGSHNSPPPVEGIPKNSLKVLFDLSLGGEPEGDQRGWDVCLSVRGRYEKPLLLRNPWQGWIYSEDFPSLVKFLDIRAHAQHFSKICSFISHPDPPTRKLSVVIATFHRYSALRESLQTVSRQTLPAKDYEVIVVNNDPRDRQVHRVVEAIRAEMFASQTDRLRLVDCPLPGLSYARNSGIAEARGDVVCFLDDDALAHENWLAQIWQAFTDHPDSGVIGGHIRLAYPQPRPKILKPGLERFWTQFLTQYVQYTDVQHWMAFPWGANWCARRKALLEIGGFRGQYGRRQKDFSGGEEIIAASLIQKLGYQIGIMPTAQVEHQPEPSRYTFQYLLSTIISQMVTNYRMRRDLYLPETIAASTQVRGLGRFSRKLLMLFRTPTSQRETLAIEYLGYMLAWALLFFEQLGDTYNRYWYRD